MTRPATTDEERTPTRRKSTLFCWGCDHASPVDGDWVRRTRNRYEEYTCPVCETTIAKRPLSDADETARDRATVRPALTWRRAIRSAMCVWRASVDFGRSSVTAMTAYHAGANGRR